jgi:hypothetical protein
VRLEVLIPIIVAVWALVVVMIMGLCAASASLERATRRQVLRALSWHDRPMRAASRASARRARRGIYAA